MAGAHGETGRRLALMTPEQLRPWAQQEQQLQNSSCSAGQSLTRAKAQNSLQESALDTPIAGLVLGDGMYAQLPQTYKQQTAETAATAITACPAREPSCSSASTDAADASKTHLHEARSAACPDGLDASSDSGGTSEDSDCAVTDTNNSDKEEEEEEEEDILSASGESSHNSLVRKSYQDDELPPQQHAEEQEHHGTCWLPVVADPSPTDSTGIGFEETPKLALGAVSLLGTTPAACSAQTSKQRRKQLRHDTALAPAAVTAAAARIVSVSSSISAAASSMMSYTVQAIARLAARQQQKQQQCQQCCTVHTTNQHPQNKQFSAPQALREEQSCQSAWSTDMNHHQHQQEQTVQVHCALQTQGHASLINHPAKITPQAVGQQQLQQTVQLQQQQQPLDQMFQHGNNRYKQVGGRQKQQLQHLGVSASLHNPQQPQPLLQASSSYLAQGVQQQPGSQAMSTTYGSKNTARKAAAASDCTVSGRLFTKRWQQIKQRRQQQLLAAPQHQQHDADIAAQAQPPALCKESEAAVAAAAAALRHAGDTAAAAMAAAGRGPKQHMRDGAQQHLGSSTGCKPAQSTSPSLTVVSSMAAVAARAKARVGRPAWPGSAAAVAVADRAGATLCSSLRQGCVLPEVPGHNGMPQTCSTVCSPQPSNPGSTSLHLPHITEVPASSAVQQHGSRPGSPTKVDFSQLEGELAAVDISSCGSSRNSSPLGSRCGARDRLHNHDLSGASGQVASSTSTGGGGTALDCTAGSTRGRPAAVPRLVLPKLPSIKEKIQPTSSSRDATPTSATAKTVPSVQQPCSPQHVPQASPHGLSALIQLFNTARIAQQTALQEQHLATQPDKQGVVQQQGASSSSSSLTAALGSTAADAVIAGSPWHSNRLSTRPSNGLTLQQAAAAAPLGYAALSPRLYEMQSNPPPPPPAAAATELTAVGAASHQGQPTSIRTNSPKQQLLKKNSRKAKGNSSSSAGRCSRPGSSNCQSRTNTGSLQSTSGIKKSIDACSSDSHSGSGAAVAPSSIRSGSGHSRPQSKCKSSRLSSGGGSGAPIRCTSASQARETMVRISIGSSSVRSNSMNSMQAFVLVGGVVSRPNISCVLTRQALARNLSGETTDCIKQDISGNGILDHCKAAAITARAAIAAAAAPVTVISVDATKGSQLMRYAPWDVSHESNSSTTSSSITSSSSCGKSSDSAAAPTPASCASALRQPPLDATSASSSPEKLQMPSVGGEHSAEPEAVAISGSSSSSSSNTQICTGNGTGDVPGMKQQDQQQINMTVRQQQQLQQHQEQHAVNTPGLSFTLVTSVLGDSNAAAPGRSLLELQLQRLEDQSAQLATVDLLETPKLPGGIAAAATAVGSMINTGGKVVTAHQAKAAAKHLQWQQQQPVVQQQAPNTGGQSQQQQRHIQSQSLAQLARVKGRSKHDITALEYAPKPVAAVAAAAPVEAVVEAGSMQHLRHQGSGNRAAAAPLCPGGASVIGGSVESKLPVAVATTLSAAFVCASAVGGDSTKIVDAATRAGPAHMQDIWA